MREALMAVAAKLEGVVGTWVSAGAGAGVGPGAGAGAGAAGEGAGADGDGDGDGDGVGAAGADGNCAVGAEGAGAAVPLSPPPPQADNATMATLAMDSWIRDKRCGRWAVIGTSLQLLGGVILAAL
jgi:hypothetical protein